MAKKHLKIKNNKPSSGSILSRLNTTIMSNIMLVMILVISAIMLVMFSYSVSTIKLIQSDSAWELILKLNPEITNSQNLDELKQSLDKLNCPYEVKGKYIFNESNNGNAELIYKDNKSNYNYQYDSTARTKHYRFKLEKDLITINMNKSIENTTYGIYLIIPQTEYIDSIMNFSKYFFAVVLLICMLIVYMCARSIARPLMTMEKAVSKIAQGDLSGRLEYTKYYEINQLVKSYNLTVNTLQRLYSSLEAQVQDRTKKLKSAYEELQNTQAMMVHSEKMKSLGELVAGIMHEINNPINFIYGNMTHLSNYSQDLIQVIEEYTKYNASLKPEEKEDIEKLKQEIDYDFLKADMPDLIKSCKEGADRAKNIIQDLKSFSRMEESQITDVDIPKEIDMTLNILHNKIKHKAEVHKEYMENVPKIEAFGGQLNQVFMNILDNSVGAIQEKGEIWIRINTDNTNKNLIIEIEDNGIGMDDETARKIFNPFFTTKPVGQGTGLGLSITYKIIKNHQGDIKVESKPDVGTKFIITLPINIDRTNLNENLVSGETNG